MTHDTFAAKLDELDERFSALHSRIQVSEKSGPEILEEDIQSLEKECDTEKQAIRANMRDSRARPAELLLRAYDEIEEIRANTKREIIRTLVAGEEGEISAENLAYLAEYMLDFAVLAANDALLVSMKAIQAQKE